MALPQPPIGGAGLGWQDNAGQPGNHLRWAFNTSSVVGFPGGGWSIYRRPSNSANLRGRYCLSLCGAHGFDNAQAHYFSVPYSNGAITTYVDFYAPQDTVTFSNAVIPAGLDLQACSLNLRKVNPLIVSLPQGVSAISITVAPLPLSANTDTREFEVQGFSAGEAVTTPMQKMSDGRETIVVDTGSAMITGLFPATMDRLIIKAVNMAIVGMCLFFDPINGDVLKNPAGAGWQGPLNVADTLALTDDLNTMQGRLPTAVWDTYKDVLGDNGLRPTLTAQINGTQPPPYTHAAAPPPGSPDRRGQATFNPKPLDMLLLAAVDPYVARALGLYFVDTDDVDTAAGLAPLSTDPAGPAYDYLIIAHYSVDLATVVWNVRYGPAPLLPAPTGLIGRSVPGGARQTRTGTVIPASPIAGLTWVLPQSGGALISTAPVAYDVRRAVLGTGDLPDPFPGDDAYGGLNTFPIMVGRSPDNNGNLVYPANYFLDFKETDTRPLQGWYAYGVRGTDIFGRHSAFSPSIALRLLHQIAPPPPANVQAKYLVNEDPYLNSDEATLVPNPGDEKLLVTWRWTDGLAGQAPQVVRFTIYHQEAFPADLKGNVTGSPTDNHDGTFTIQTDLPIAVADAPLYKGGQLLAIGNTLPVPSQPSPFFVLSVQGGFNATLTILPRIAAGGTVGQGVTPVNGPLTLTAGKSNKGAWAGVLASVAATPQVPQAPGAHDATVGAYQYVTGSFVLSLAPGQLKTSSYIGVSSTASIAGSALELEGQLSPPSLIVKLNRTPPPVLIWDILPDISGPVDFNGISLFPVSPTPQPGVRFEVWRALDESVAKAAGMSLSTFRGKLFKEQQVLATAHPEAFSLRTPKPLLPPDDPLPYMDPIPGRSRSFYFYRTRSVDGIGNRSAFSDSTKPVRPPYSTPPPPPVLIGVTSPADRQITLVWRPTSDPVVPDKLHPGPTMVEYRIYRYPAPGATSGEDLRLMTKVGTVPASDGDIAAGKVSFTDADPSLRGGIAYTYRIVAVESGDADPNTGLTDVVSDSSNPVVAYTTDSAPPDAPVLDAPVRSAGPDTITLTWTNPPNGDDLRALVQRQEAGKTTWLNVSARLNAGVTTFADTVSLDLAKTYTYRLNVINGAGNASYSATQVSAP